MVSVKKISIYVNMFICLSDACAKKTRFLFTVYILSFLSLLSAKMYIVILTRKRTTIHTVALPVYKYHKTCNIPH